MLAALVLLILVALAGIAFLESGANTGKVILDPAEAYARGSVEFVGKEHLYLVRLTDGTFLALSDLDAANRANLQRRCRVSPVPVSDPWLPQLLERLGGRMSAGAAGSTLVFREDCNQAVYDVTGLRLDADAPNLDRYPVSISETGLVGVDVSKRSCTARAGAQLFAAIPCK
ncbi:MAG: hypothetical protein C0506_09510 [Anaerolinea sp.]|nr:hypothetical protein [Anaerolinea sp.]